MIGQRKPGRNASYKWFKLTQGHNSLSEPTHVCLFTCTIFPPNKHFTCFTIFRLCGNSFLQRWRARALSLASGLVVRIQRSHCCGLTSISGREPKSCFKPLKAEATEIIKSSHKSIRGQIIQFKNMFLISYLKRIWIAMQRSCANCQEAHEEKMLNIISHQANANQNHNEIYFIPTRMATIKNTDNNKCWLGCRENGILIQCW